MVGNVKVQGIYDNIKNNNFVGKTFNFTKLNNKYIVAATNKIEKMTPNTFPTLFGFFLFFRILNSP